MACLRGQQARLVLVCIEQVVDQVRAHPPHHDEDEQGSADGEGRLVPMGGERG